MGCRASQQLDQLGLRPRGAEQAHQPRRAARFQIEHTPDPRGARIMGEEPRSTGEIGLFAIRKEEQHIMREALTLRGALHQRPRALQQSRTSQTRITRTRARGHRIVVRGQHKQRRIPRTGALQQGRDVAHGDDDGREVADLSIALARMQSMVAFAGQT